MFNREEKPALNGESLEQLIQQSGMSKDEEQKFLNNLELQLRIDNHDMAIDDRLEIISTCFDKAISTVIM